MVVLDQQETNKIVHDAYKGIQDILQGLKQIAKDYARENNTDLFVFMDPHEYNDEGYICGPAAVVHEIDYAEVPENWSELKDYVKDMAMYGRTINKSLGRILSVGVQLNDGQDECFVITRNGETKSIGDFYSLGLSW